MTDFDKTVVHDLRTPEAYILAYAQRDLLKSSELSPGPHCFHPNRETYLLVQRVATKLGQNTEKDSFANFMYYYYKSKEISPKYSRDFKSDYLEKIKNKMKETNFDIDSMKAEVAAIFQDKKDYMKDPTNKMSTCLTKRTDVWEKAEKWFNGLFDSIREFYFEDSNTPETEAVEGGKKKKGTKKTAKKYTKNLCLKKSVKKNSANGTSKCEKVKGCKVASGSKRAYCRKKHNKTHKKK